MMYPVTVKCWNVVELHACTTWAYENNLVIVNRTWDVIDQRQHVTFNFRNPKHATLFALRWS